MRSFIAFALVALVGCSKPHVVVYCAHDREFAQEILDAFQKESGLEVRVRYDTEANKSVGLYDDLIREAGAPRCDVHWNNEILATLRLQEKGILQPYASPSAKPFPAMFKAADHTWTAFAARARVLIVNTDLVKEDDSPTSLADLTNARWRGKVAMAKPMFGTTATHAACLFQVWGAEKASEYYRQLHQNQIAIVPGNKQVALDVGKGKYAIGMTDTDDAVAEIDAGRPVKMIFPDAEARLPSKDGVLFIPNTAAMIKGCPNPENARKFIDFLLSPDVEMRLARSKSRQIPLNPTVVIDAIPHIRTPAQVRSLPVDFPAAMAKWNESQAFLVQQFSLR